jgi:hypothetical protein
VGVLLAISRSPEPWRWSDQRRRPKPASNKVSDGNDKRGGKRNVRRNEPRLATA